MRRPLISKDASLTFADYFKLSASAEEVVGHFGYSLIVKPCTLPGKKLVSDAVTAMKSRLERSLSFVSLTAKSSSSCPWEGELCYP